MTLFLLPFLFGLLAYSVGTMHAEKMQFIISDFYKNVKSNHRVSMRHIEGGGIGYKKGYTTIEGFFAPRPNRLSLMPFLDLRGHVFNDGKIATNIGVGVRAVKNERVYGINTYYDYRNIKKNHAHQLGIGFEAIGKRWDFLTNGYFPFSKKEVYSCPAQFFRFSGNHMLLSQKYQFIMNGFDAKLGVHCGNARSFDFYVAAGPYYFANEGKHVWGGKGSIACKFKEYISLELSNSYDTMFRNRFQCQITFTLPFGGRSKKEASDILSYRMIQSVNRQEIVVVGHKKRCVIATDPQTDQPLNFIFVDNTSHSLGTYESPYNTLTDAQNASKAGDILYVFPGDGTTAGMNKGITLKRDQKLWGSSIDHLLEAAQGSFIIPAQSSIAPTITNTDIDTDGTAITLDSVNEVSGFVIKGAVGSSLLGTNLEHIEIMNCSIKESTVFSVDASFVGQATITFINNNVEHNENGVNLVFNGPSTVLVSHNNFSDNTSVNIPPLTVNAGANALEATITDNNITNNISGGIRCVLNNTSSAQLTIKNNVITNNGTGAVGPFGAPLFIDPNNTSLSNCSLELTENTLTNNTGVALYCVNGDFDNFQLNATDNTIVDNGGGFIFANPSNTFQLNAARNTITHNNDHGIATANVLINTADIAITNNTITNNLNSSSAVALSHSGNNTNLVVTNNDLSNNQTSGIVMYSSEGIHEVTATIAHNAINNNHNAESNAASGIDLEQFVALSGSIMNNTLIDNTGVGLFIGTTQASSSVCLEMSGNSNNTGYTLSNDSGIFNLAPCNVDAVNVGTITTIGVITPVQSCPDAIACS